MADLTQAAADVLAERKRQIEVEGWSEQHDDAHSGGEMALAAAVYATSAARADVLSEAVVLARLWPWSRAWWKPTSPRGDLVRAGALILAEIERLDRAAARA